MFHEAQEDSGFIYDNDDEKNSSTYPFPRQYDHQYDNIPSDFTPEVRSFNYFGKSRAEKAMEVASSSNG